MLRINPDKEFVKEMREKIKENSGYCPCLLDKNEDTICPCKDMRENQICHCGLYK